MLSAEPNPSFTPEDLQLIKDFLEFIRKPPPYPEPQPTNPQLLSALQELL